MPKPGEPFTPARPRTVTVDIAGGGDFSTMHEALNWVASQSPSTDSRWTVEVYPGAYYVDRKITVPEWTTVVGLGSARQGGITGVQIVLGKDVDHDPIRAGSALTMLSYSALKDVAVKFYNVPISADVFVIDAVGQGVGLDGVTVEALVSEAWRGIYAVRANGSHVSLWDCAIFCHQQGAGGGAAVYVTGGAYASAQLFDTHIQRHDVEGVLNDSSFYASAARCYSVSFRNAGSSRRELNNAGGGIITVAGTSYTESSGDITPLHSTVN